MSEAIEKLRADKWLWQARFFKTRTLAAARIKAGALRVNGTVTSKPSSMVAPGDVLTFAQGDHIRVIEITVLGTRRGSRPGGPDPLYRPFPAGTQGPRAARRQPRL